MRPPVLELVIPAAVRPDAVVQVLATRINLVAGMADVEDRVLFDSIDGRLREAGIGLERAVGPREALGPFVLREAGSRDERLDAATPREDRVLASELPDGRLRDRLAVVLDERAALPLARVASRSAALSVLNADQKTVARIRLEEPELRGPGGAIARLDARLHLIGVRGYDKAFERVRGVLQDEIGLAQAARSLVEEVVAASGSGAAGGGPDAELAPDMRTDAAALAVCRALASVVEANLPGTLTDLDPEFLHDLRVAVRRSRSVLRELKGAFAPEDRSHAREDLRWIQQITGPARDLDVHLLEWPAAVAELPANVIADLVPLEALLERTRGEAHATMRTEIAGEHFVVAWADWRALLDRDLASEPDTDRPDAARPIAEVAGRRIRRVYKRMRTDGARIDDDSPAEALHDLRKRGKELRYLLELFGGVFADAKPKPLVSALKGLQDVLGRFQDRHVQAEFLRGLGPALAKGPGGPDALIALGVVIERLVADQDAARAEFGERFATFAAKPTRRIVKQFR